MRYYFHIRDAARLIVDDEGLELADLTSAIEEAEASGRAMLIDASAENDHISDQVIEVTDGRGIVLHELRLSGALTGLRTA